jgi:hypothetical protein
MTRPLHIIVQDLTGARLRLDAARQEVERLQAEYASEAEKLRVAFALDMYERGHLSATDSLSVMSGGM